MRPHFKCVRCKKRFITQAQLEAHKCEKDAVGLLATYETDEVLVQ
jgi:hypothetical protein